VILISTVIFSNSPVTRLFLVCSGREHVRDRCEPTHSPVPSHLYESMGVISGILIVGSGSRAVEFARWLSRAQNSALPNHWVCGSNWGGTDAFQRSGYVLACDLGGLAQFLRTNVCR